MTTTVGDIIELMDNIAPQGLAETWDNVGLQVGKRRWPVKRLRVALDPLPRVVQEACRDHVDLLITHHPLIFKPLTMIDFDAPIGRMIRMAARKRLSIFAAHTNLDSARDGLNDLLASRIGLKEVKVFLDASPPSNQNVNDDVGLGRIGLMDAAMALADLAAEIKTKLNVDSVKYAGNPHLSVNKVAVCTGSGSGLMAQFFKSDAQVFITGDLRYHDARDAEANRRGLIDIGHFASEHLIVAHLKAKLLNMLAIKGHDVQVDVSSSEREPFVSL